jgi:hypothetical protein
MAATIFLIIGVFFNMSSHDDFRQRTESARAGKKKFLNYKKTYDDMKQTLVQYLGKEYPTFEKEIFEKMSPEEKSEIGAYFVKYPELNTAQGFQKLIDEMSINSRLLEICNEIDNDIRHMRALKASQWIIVNLSIPSDLQSDYEKIPGEISV